VDTLCHQWNNGGVLDLNDLRTFERVGALRSFSAAARALAQPKSTVSRSIARLEAALGARLIQRTTRDVALTPAGESLMARCAAALGQLGEAIAYVGSLAAEPRGPLRVSAGIGFAINVLADQLPEFARRHPEVDILLDVTSRNADLVNDPVDVAIRLGPLPDSSLVSVRLGEMRRVLCGAPDYLNRRGMPQTVADLAGHDIIEMPGSDGRPRAWSFTSDERTEEVCVSPRIGVNDALTINRLIISGAGVGIISCYLCAPEIAAGRLVHLLPAWAAPSVGVAIVFPSKRELAPAVRAFVEFMKDANPPGFHWLNNSLPGET
jgi:DNA-binding transcriptional LysR family regulator